MQISILYAIWGGLYLLTAGLAFLPPVSGALKVLLIAISLLFFAPPALLLAKAQKEQDKKTCNLIIGLSLLSLGLTVVMLILNLISINAGDSVGLMLNGLLMVVSAPMGCSQYWVLGIFGWACLLFTSLTIRKSFRKTDVSKNSENTEA